MRPQLKQSKTVLSVYIAAKDVLKTGCVVGVMKHLEGAWFLVVR